MNIFKLIDSVIKVITGGLVITGAGFMLYIIVAATLTANPPKTCQLEVVHGEQVEVCY